MKKAAIFIAEGFEEVEAITQADLLRRAGIDAQLVSVNNEKRIKGAHNIEITCDFCIGEIEKDSYDALILPGGMPGTTNLEKCNVLCEMLKDYAKKGKIVAAICAAPLVLGHLGLLNKKNACCYPGIEKELEGAFIVNAQSIVDGNIITSRGVGTAIEFATSLISALEDDEKSEKIRESIVYGF